MDDERLEAFVVAQRRRRRVRAATLAAIGLVGVVAVGALTRQATHRDVAGEERVVAHEHHECTGIVRVYADDIQVGAPIDAAEVGSWDGRSAVLRRYVPSAHLWGSAAGELVLDDGRSIELRWIGFPPDCL